MRLSGLACGCQVPARYAADVVSFTLAAALVGLLNDITGLVRQPGGGCVAPKTQMARIAQQGEMPP
jgi:hypothetical protein